VSLLKKLRKYAKILQVLWEFSVVICFILHFFYIKFSNLCYVAGFIYEILLFIYLTCLICIIIFFLFFSPFLMKGDIGTMASGIHWELIQLLHFSVRWYVCS
jgi:hypothetical protein